MERIERPGSVTFVVVLTWLYAIATVIMGAALLLASDNSEALDELEVSSSDATVAGWTILGLGVLIALVAIGLAKGSRLSRFLAIAVLVLRIGAEVFAVIDVASYPWWQAALSAGWALLLIALLSTRSASRFFLQR